MKAVIASDARPVLVDRPAPTPSQGQVLADAHATAVNRADLLQVAGHYNPPEGTTDVLGLEVAGVVSAVGAGVNEAWIGKRVGALLAGGGYAEQVAVDVGSVFALPREAGWTEGAAIPEVFLTAHQALDVIGRVQPGEHVLIHAGASGVGTAAIQLVRMRGAVPHVTASPAKHDACRSLGAQTAIDYASEPWADRVLEATDGAGADVILDFIGAPYAQDHVRVLARDGRWVVLALMGTPNAKGSPISDLDLRALFAKRGTLVTSTLRSRSADYKAALVRSFALDVLPGFASGALRPVVDRTFGLDEVAEAHAYVRARKNVGKVVLTMG
jgi:putative PIG3 family NAD(P)H quinone oxidoreductase